MLTTATTRDIKLVAVGNSRGVRLPRELLRKFGISDVLNSTSVQVAVFPKC